jgi:hypothetical protein
MVGMVALLSGGMDRLLDRICLGRGLQSVLSLRARGLRVRSHGPRYWVYGSNPLRQVGLDRVKYNSRRYGNLVQDYISLQGLRRRRQGTAPSGCLRGNPDSERR